MAPLTPLSHVAMPQNISIDKEGNPLLPEL
jgi:hypothetical protein